MQSPASHSLWQLIDGAFVINLDQRADRWAQFQAAVRDLIPAEKLHRLSACVGRDLPGFGQRPWFRGGKRDNTWAGRGGCLQSHRRALLKAREAGWRTVLVLEDDATFGPALPTLLEPLAAALRQTDWQVCYLGFTEPWGPHRLLARLGDRHGLYQLHGCNTAHAYLVRKSAREWILRHLPDEGQIWPWLAQHRAVDRWYQRQLGLRFPVVCVSPSLINQAAGFSDIMDQPTRYTAEADRAPAVSSPPSAYEFRRTLRHLSVRVGRADDAAHGLIRRWRGF
jgi:glycosyl transferase family 25